MNVIFTAKTVIEGNFVVKEPIQILYCLHKIDLYGKSSVSCPLKPSDSAPLC